MAQFEKFGDAKRAGMQRSVFITNPTADEYPQGWHYFATVEEARIAAATEAYPEQRVIYDMAGSLVERLPEVNLHG